MNEKTSSTLLQELFCKLTQSGHYDELSGLDEDESRCSRLLPANGDCPWVEISRSGNTGGKRGTFSLRIYYSSQDLADKEETLVGLETLDSGLPGREIMVFLPHGEDHPYLKSFLERLRDIVPLRLQTVIEEMPPVRP